MKSVPAKIYIKPFKAEYLVTEKCVQYNLTLNIWYDPLAKYKLASVNSKACQQVYTSVLHSA